MGFFQRLKSDPQAEKHFKHALEVYGQLRRYPERSLQYRRQLVAISSSCRLAIQLNDRHGDAHVLLANSYLLMFIDGFPEVGDPLPLKLAAAVIQHWADEPMRQYPWTKNAENGHTIHAQVEDAVRTFLPTQRDPSSLQQLKAQYYADAISRDMLPQQ